jgi:hypothetical protein
MSLLNVTAFALPELAIIEADKTRLAAIPTANMTAFDMVLFILSPSPKS